MNYERVFILEITGPTLEFLRERLEYLPTFRRFIEQGTFSNLIGPLQPVLAPSFATLYTGNNPGKTGFFDFFRFPAGSYDRIPFSADQLKRQTFFHRLSAAGKRVGLLNAFLVSPLPELAGFVVSADDGIGNNYARPPEVLKMLQDQKYHVPFGASYSPGRERAFYQHCMKLLSTRRRAMRALFEHCAWDFGMLTIHVYGELLHAFWKFYDPRHPEYRPFKEVFGKADPFVDCLVFIDDMLSDIVELAGSNGLVIVLGAWGHRLEHSTVYLNAVLERAGYLKFKRTPASRAKHWLFRMGLTSARAERLAHTMNLYKVFHYKLARGRRAAVTGATFLSYHDIDWARTRAVAMGYLGQVFMNVRGHRPSGVIERGDYTVEREQLRGLLSELEDPRTGEPIVEKVWTREELYAGEELTHAPDLIVHFLEGYSGHSGIAGGGKVVTRSPPNHSSDHWNESLLLALGPRVRAGEIEARLEDIAPTVLHALGVDSPEDCDGSVLPLFDQARVSERDSR